MKNIAGKLIRVMEECSAVPKNGTNDFHHYKYATSADVLEKVNASLVKHNLASIVVPEIISNCDVVTNKGNTEHLVTVKVSITLIDGDSGESLTLVGLGSGQDAGDKAVMKAETAGIKYAFMLSFSISTNDDPEADSKTDEEVYASDVGKSNTVAANDHLVCTDCGNKITTGIRNVSMKKYGRPLCMKCQRKAMAIA
ncbi:MAG: ERF family protein [Phycisphaerales bacterium]